MAIASDSVLARLQAEARQLIDNLCEKEVPTGDSMIVEFDSSFAKKHSLGRYGRMVCKDNDTVFHAAPSVIDRTVTYDFPEHNYIDWVNQWLDGRQRGNPVDKMVKGPGWPVPREFKRNPLDDYEAHLFRVLAGDEITLVNPSFSAMRALLPIGGYVTTTADINEDWAYGITHFVKQSRGRLKLLPKKFVRGIAYLGTNNPLWYPRSKWVRLIFSPYIDPSVSFEQYSVQYYENCVVSRFKKKEDYETVSTIFRDSNNVIFNPNTLDTLLFGMEKKMFFFLEGSDPISCEQIEDKKVRHSPWFVDYEGIWMEKDKRLWLVRKEFVIDVKSTGTYLSRRSILPPSGYTWVPLSLTGTHWVTYSSVFPQELYGVTKAVYRGNDILTFDSVVPVFQVQRCYAQQGWSFQSTRPLSGFYYPLVSDDPLFYCDSMGEQSFNFVYVTAKGHTFSPRSARETGAIFSPSPHGRTNVPLMGQGDLWQPLVFVTSLATYIDCSDVTSMSFAFSDVSQIKNVSSVSSLFSTKWASFKTLVDGRTDPDYGGGVSHDSLVHSIHSFLKGQIPISPTCPLRTVVQVADAVGCSVPLAYRYLSRLPGYFLWKPGSMAMSVFVRGDCLTDIFFDGRVSLVFGEEEMSMHSWYSALEYINKDRKVTLHCSVLPRQFILFLQRNFCMVSSKVDGCISKVVIRSRKF